MPSQGRPHTPETRERISRGVRRALTVRAEQERLVPRLAAFRRRRGSDPMMRALLDLAANEVVELVDALGGVDQISPQRLRLIEDIGISGVLLGRELLAYIDDRDGDAASRVVSLINSRRSSLAQVGLDVRKADPLDINAYQDAIEEERS